MLPLNPLYEAVPVSELTPKDIIGEDDVSKDFLLYEDGVFIGVGFFSAISEFWIINSRKVYPTHYLRPLSPERMEEWVRDLIGRTAAYMRFKADMPSEFPDLQTFTDNLINEMSK